MLCAADLEVARRLDVELSYHAVVDDHREALAARTHTEAAGVEGQAEGLGELAVAVGEHRDVGRAVRLVPRAEHERVVDRGGGDLVDALGLELGGLLDEARQVLGRAGRRERARDREQRDLLAREVFAALDFLGAVVGRLDQSHVWNPGALRNRHVRSSF